MILIFSGLAVLSMCADLAASELKWLFIKIHYFGRRIKWKKRRDTKVDDVRTFCPDLFSDSLR
jgi:hypothetical protein